MPLNDLLHDRKTKATSLFLCSKEGIKYPVHVFLTDSTTFVFNLNAVMTPFLVNSDVYDAPILHGLYGISIRVEEEKDNFLIEIEDTGCGMSRENVKTIFNPFFTTNERGSGLGLSIVRKIIEGHRGTISIESEEGEGTRVKVLLPRE